jgi:hypothetical protein
VAVAFCHWVFIYGPHQNLLSDNGPQFSSKFFQACCQILGVKQAFTTPYHPQANGQVERHNRTILSQPRKYIGYHQDDWDLFNRALTYAYNTQVHSSTNVSPFELVLSRPSKQSIIQYEANPNQLEASVSQVDDFRTAFLVRLHGIREKATRSIQLAGLSYQRHANRNVRSLALDKLVGSTV